MHSHLVNLIVTQTILIYVVHVFQVSDLHDVCLESLLEDFLEDSIAIRVVSDPHSHETVVVEPEQRSASYFVLHKELLVLVAVVGAVSSIPLADIICCPVVDRLGSECFCLKLISVNYNIYGFMMFETCLFVCCALFSGTCL
jgi:hypothetical protein